MASHNLSTILSLSNVRIAFLFVAFVHLLVTATVTLNIDTTVDNDPKVRVYHYVRWKLITCWFNLLTLPYLPARLYCEWKTCHGDIGAVVKKLNQVTEVMFTAILFPVILFSDITFWLIFNMDPNILAPPPIFDVYLPHWAQHSLHTASLIMVLLDLVLTPREKPSNLKPRVALLLIFSLAYIITVVYSYSKGEMVYRVFETMTSLQLSFISLMFLVVVFIIFFIQWVVIDLIWQRKPAEKMKK